MALWIKSRRFGVLILAGVVTLIMLALPGSATSVSPSPAGATLAAACFIGLGVPVFVAWGCAQGDPLRERISVRHIRTLDLLLALAVVGGASGAAIGSQLLQIAPAGAIAGRAMIAYLGLLLLAYPAAGWRRAAIVPTVYLILVAVLGRGADIYHPAPWAWIAADERDFAAWCASTGVLAAGASGYALLGHTGQQDAED